MSKENLQSAMNIKKSLEDLKEMLPYILENERLQSIVKKEKFDSMVNSGFTESQALELCK